MNIMSIDFGTILKSLRQARAWKILDLAMASGIDPSLLSKYEHGHRAPSIHHVHQLLDLFGSEGKQLKRQWLADKIYELVRDEDDPGAIWALADNRIEYLKTQPADSPPVLSGEISSDLTDLDSLKLQWNKVRPLSSIQLNKLQQYFHTMYTHDSNQIEGNTLTFQETHLVVNEGLTISGKSMREHLEAINHQEAIDYLIDLVHHKEEFSKRVLLELHHLILKSIDSQHAGVYRSVPVKISGSRHEPPQPYLIDKLMEDYFIYYENQKKVMHPVILAAEMHERLASIHPFIDGNGRTSRLIMNLILLRHGYTLTSLKGDSTSRLKYYQALEKVQVENDPSMFYRLIIEAVKRSLRDHLDAV
jgi:Fic family protein